MFCVIQTIMFLGDVDGFIAFDGEEPIGMVLFGYSYSTWVNQVNK